MALINLALQAPNNGIGNVISDIWQNPYNPLAQAFSYSTLIAYFVLAAIIIFFVVRSLMRYGMYAGKGTPHGAFTIGFVGPEGYAHGNLSTNEWFNEEMFRKIKKKEKEYSMDYDELKKLVEEEKIFIYDYKVTDHSKTWSFKEYGNVLIISNGKIQSDEFSAIDKHGRFSFTSALLKEYPRNATAYSFSRRYELPDPWGKKIDVWWLALLPQTPKKVMSDGITQEHYEITVNTIENTEALAKAVVLLPELINLQEKNQIKEQELDNYRQLLEKAHQKGMQFNVLLNKARHFLQQKIFVGYDKPQAPLQKVSEIAFIFGAFLVALFSYEEMPKILPNIHPIIPAIGGLVIIIMVREIWKKKQETTAEGLDREIKEELRGT